MQKAQGTDAPCVTTVAVLAISEPPSAKKIMQPVVDTACRVHLLLSFKALCQAQQLFLSAMRFLSLWKVLHQLEARSYRLMGIPSFLPRLRLLKQKH